MSIIWFSDDFCYLESTLLDFCCYNIFMLWITLSYYSVVHYNLKSCHFRNPLNKRWKCKISNLRSLHYVQLEISWIFDELKEIKIAHSLSSVILISYADIIYLKNLFNHYFKSIIWFLLIIFLFHNFRYQIKGKFDLFRRFQEDCSDLQRWHQEM